MKKFMNNFRKPQGFLGKLVLCGMNIGHRSLWEWCLSRVDLPKSGRMLDIGCGGGGMIANLLHAHPDLSADGLDHSEESLRRSRKVNAESLGARCNFRQGTAEKLPYEDNLFDFVTAMESIYFWDDLRTCFCEVNRVLKKSGLFIIGVEAADPLDTTWSSRIDGMRIYSPDELETLLESAGFSVVLREGEKEKACIVGRKMGTQENLLKV